jgi:hypothetical protein
MTQIDEAKTQGNGDEGKARPRTVTITINNKEFKIQSPILGSELRALGEIASANQLFEERPGPDLLIEPNVSYTVKEGAHFYDLPIGTVGR